MSQEIDNKGNSNPALIWEYYNDKNEQSRLFNSKEILQRIGEPLFAVFMKCLNGIDRVLVLENMIELNEKNYKIDSITFKVNRDVLFQLISGTLYELKKALQKLFKCKVVKKIQDTTYFDELNETRKTLDEIKILSKLRNKIAFHLGDIEDYCKGFKEMTANGYEFILLKSDEIYQRGSFILSWDALSKGLGIDEEDYKNALDKIREIKSSLPNQLLNVFDEVLKKADIQVIDNRKKSSKS